MMAIIAALVLALPCAQQRENCAASCQGTYTKDAACRNAASATYDKCSKGCDNPRYSAQDNQLCANTCKSSKDSADKTCLSQALDCIEKCMASKHCT